MAECVLSSGARLNLGMSHLPEDIAAHDYYMHEPPESSASWTEELVSSIQQFKERLQQIPSLEAAMSTQVCKAQRQHHSELLNRVDEDLSKMTPIGIIEQDLPEYIKSSGDRYVCELQQELKQGEQDQALMPSLRSLLWTVALLSDESSLQNLSLQLWKYALQGTVELVLDGLSGVRACTAMGRTAMSSDLQDLGYSLRAVLDPMPQDLVNALDSLLRLVDEYIKVSKLLNCVKAPVHMSISFQP